MLALKPKNTSHRPKKCESLTLKMQVINQKTHVIDQKNASHRVEYTSNRKKICESSNKAMKLAKNTYIYLVYIHINAYEHNENY